MNNQELIQGTKEWEEMRKGKIGASDAPIILGVSPYKTPYQLWREKISLDENEVTWAMEEGTRKEPIARKELEKITGLKLFPKVKFHKEYDWMMASIDAIDEKETFIAEIKWPCKEDHEMAKTNKVPDKYYPQVQHQMFVLGVDFIYYYSFYQESPKKIDIQKIQVERNDLLIHEIIKKEKEFYQWVKDFVPPPLMERDYQKITDPTAEQLASAYTLIQKELEELEAEKERIREELILYCGNHNSIIGPLKLSLLRKKGNIDYAKVPELKGVDLEQYRKKSIEYWKVT